MNELCSRCRHLLTAIDAVSGTEIHQCGYDGGDPLERHEDKTLCPAIHRVIHRELSDDYSINTVNQRQGAPADYQLRA